MQDLYCITAVPIMLPRDEIGDIFIGVFLLFIIHFLSLDIALLLIQLFLFLYLDDVPDAILYALFRLSIFQIIYVIPTVFWARSQQEWGLMKGIIIGAIITVLLNTIIKW